MIANGLRRLANKKMIGMRWSPKGDVLLHCNGYTLRLKTQEQIEKVQDALANHNADAINLKEFLQNG